MKTDYNIIKNEKSYTLKFQEKMIGHSIDKKALLQLAWIEMGSNKDMYLACKNGEVHSNERK